MSLESQRLARCRGLLLIYNEEIPDSDDLWGADEPGDGRKLPSVPVLFQRGLPGCNAALDVEILNVYMRWLSVLASGPVG